MEEVAESQTDSSGSITVKLTVEQKDNPAGKTEIEGEAKGQTLLYLDVSLMLHKGSEMCIRDRYEPGNYDACKTVSYWRIVTGQVYASARFEQRRISS